MIDYPRRRVVITGVAPITAIGIGKEAVWDSIRAGRSGISRLSLFDTSHLKAHCAGEVRDWDPTAFFASNRLKRLDRYAQFSVASALMALEDAGLPWSKEKPQANVGVSFGTALGGISNAEEEHMSFLQKGARGVNQTLALQVFGGSAHSNIAIECGLQGVGTTNSNSCASGVVSIGEAMRYIRDEMADVVVAGAAEAPLSPLTFSAFDFIKTMSRWSGDPLEHACRPFDLNRDGFVMGEGAASLVVEELEHARRRGAHIYCEVLGYSLNNEAYHMTSPLPSGEAVQRCMRAALKDARIEPEQVEYINAHASSTQMNDSNESACIQTVFGPHAARVAVSGTKAFTAHPLGASGAIEAVFCALAIERGFLPPTLHYTTPDPACPLDVVPNQGREQRVRCAMNNAFGFGGINASLVMAALDE